MTEIFFRLRIPDGFAPDDATQLILTRALETEAARLGVPLAGSMDVASSFVLGRRAWLLAYVAACARFGPVGFGHIRPWAELFAQGAGGAEAVRVLARAFDLPDGASSVAIASAMGATPERLRGWLSMRSAAAAGGMLSELFEAGYLMRIGSAPTGAMDGWHQQRARSCSYHVPSVDGMAAAAALSPDIIASAEHAASITAPRMRWGALASDAPSLALVRSAWAQWHAQDSEAMREGLAQARVTTVATVRRGPEPSEDERAYGSCRPRAGRLPAGMAASGAPTAPVSLTIGHASRDGSMDATDDDAPPAPVRTVGRGSAAVAGAGGVASSRQVSARYRPTW